MNVSVGDNCLCLTIRVRICYLTIMKKDPNIIPPHDLLAKVPLLTATPHGSAKLGRGDAAGMINASS
jgi:hypothetical protein